jgi:DNA-binding transcriptional regulator YhcF (GntR family)
MSLTKSEVIELLPGIGYAVACANEVPESEEIQAYRNVLISQLLEMCESVGLTLDEMQKIADECDE